VAIADSRGTGIGAAGDVASGIVDVGERRGAAGTGPEFILAVVGVADRASGVRHAGAVPIGVVAEGIAGSPFGVSWVRTPVQRVVVVAGDGSFGVGYLRVFSVCVVVIRCRPAERIGPPREAVGGVVLIAGLVAVSIGARDQVAGGVVGIAGRV